MNEEELARLVVRLVGDTESYQQMFTAAAEKSGEMERASRKLGAAEKATAEAIRMGAEVTRQAESASEKYARQAREVKSLLDQQAISQTTANRTMKQARKAYFEAGNAATQYGRSIMSAGRAGMFRVTAPIVGIGVAAVAAGSSIETAFAGVQKTVNASEEQLQGLKSEFEDFITQGNAPFDMTELLGAAETAGQLGIKFENIVGFAKTVKNLELATNLGDAAGESLARIANITGLPQTQFENLGSTIVALGNNSAATESDIVDMTLRLGAAGRIIGLTVPQTTAFAASLASVGINAEAGGTAFSKLFVDMARQVATGGKNLDAFAKTAGMSVDEFSEKFRVDAAGAVKALMTGLSQLDGAGAIQAMDAMGISEQRMTDAILRSAGAVDLMTDSMDLADRAFAENTALAAEAEVRYDSFAGIVKNAWAQLGLLGAEIFTTVRPALVTGIRWLTATVGAFMELDGATKAFIVGVAIAAAAIPPLMVAIGGLITVGGMASIALTSLSTAGFTASGAMATLQASLLPIVSAAMPIIGTAAAIGLAFVGLVGQGDTMSEKLSSVFDQIKNMAATAYNSITASASAIGDAIVSSLSEPISNLGTLFSPVTDFFVSIGNRVTELAGNFARLIGLGKVFSDLGKDESIIGYFRTNMAAVTEFNRETQRAIELNKELQAVLAKASSTEIADIQSIADPAEQVAALEEYQSIVENNLEGIANQIGSQTRMIDSEFSGLDRVLGNKNLELAEQTLGELETRRDQLREEAATIRKLLAAGAVMPSATAPEAPAMPTESQQMAGQNVETIQKFEQQYKTLGMTEIQKAIFDIEVRADELEAAGQDAAELRGQITDLQGLEAAIEIKTNALQVAETIKNKMADLKQAIGAIGLEGVELQLFNLENLGATKEQLEQIKPLLVEFDVKTKANKAAEKQKADADKLIEQYLPPKEKFEKRQAELQAMLDKGLIDKSTYESAVTDAEKQLKGLEDQTKKDYSIDLSVKGVDAVEAGSAEALARVREYAATRIPRPDVPPAPGLPADSPAPQAPQAPQAAVAAGEITAPSAPPLNALLFDEAKIKQQIENIEATMAKTDSAFRLVRLEESLDIAKGKAAEIRAIIDGIGGSVDVSVAGGVSQPAQTISDISSNGTFFGLKPGQGLPAAKSMPDIPESPRLPRTTREQTIAESQAQKLDGRIANVRASIAGTDSEFRRDKLTESLEKLIARQSELSQLPSPNTASQSVQSNEPTPQERAETANSNRITPATDRDREPLLRVAVATEQLLALQQNRPLIELHPSGLER